MATDPSDTNSVAPDSLATTMFRTLLYADVFGFPLTVVEIQRFLVGRAASVTAVERALREEAWLAERVVMQDGFVALAGREVSLRLRTERLGYSQGLQRQARRYGHVLAALPFVRAVLLTGSLAVENSRDARDDIDYLLITGPGRLWLVRLFAVALVRVARVLGADICPNYLLARDRLGLSERSLFTAHELAQMVPLHGAEVYAELIAANA
ncbi:MAG: hypothetical protein V1772_10465 [Chloroflexota bacterium]